VHTTTPHSTPVPDVWYGWPRGELAPAGAAALDSPKTGFFIFGKNLVCLYSSGNAAPLSGIDGPPFLVGVPVIQFQRVNGSLSDESLETMETLLLSAARGEGDRTAGFRSTDGSRSITVEVRRIASECWMATFEDVTGRREAESQLVNLALRDALTGLANRSHFERSVVSALNGNSATAILMIDLDRFKAVNDTLGHPTGDALLRLVSQRLLSAVKQYGVAARIGGDEFSVLITSVMRPAELAGLASRIIDLLRRTFLVNDHALNVGASIGIAVSPDDGETMELLLKRADLALYHSKARGGGKFHFFEKAMEERAQARRTLELELRKALPLRQLEVYYHPQIDTVTRTLRGFEAAIRWRHPRLGLLEPREFCGLAEELGLTVQIGEWMLRAACRQANSWPERLKVSLPTSLPQFESGRLVEAVTRALEASSLAGSRLEIEVTEEILLQNEASVFATLHSVRALGVQVVMDEFGTGYASLCQLANFPFDRVNINRELFAAGAGNAKHRAIVCGIAALGASLGIATVGEGIGTADELARIHADGCDSVQGFLPSEGFPETEIRELIDLAGLVGKGHIS
jgi:diguanylate cyclase (GGDEF)-like protein